MNLDHCFLGDCREGMRAMAAAGLKVQTCVTSPPYYGLRDYGHEGQIGLEETPDEYIARLVDVFRHVRELLADDGTLWINIGDSYAGSWGAEGRTTSHGNSAWNAICQNRDKIVNHPKKSRRLAQVEGQRIKAKDLYGIPWMLAFALRADGWYLRQEIIWHKPNPMPESVRDRCTKAHESIFLLAKSERYFFDAEAIKEPATYDGHQESAPKGSFAGKRADQDDRMVHGSFRALVEKRNKRSVWSVATIPYKGAHFATFPPALIEPCILAGSRAGDVVLDPFMGSGTVAHVAQRLGRRWLGCELNPEYLQLQLERTRQPGLILGESA